MTDKATAYLVSRAMSEDYLSFSKVKGALSNTPLYPQAAQPDCRTCTLRPYCESHHSDYRYNCTNGDKYQLAPKVVLWRTEP